MKIRNQALLIACVVAPVMSTGCGRVQAKSAFRDGNRSYQDENFRKAIDQYTRAVEKDPTMAEAYFYLGSSHQALHRPGKETDENKKQLDDSIAAYKKSLEVNDASTENLKKVKANTLAALTGIYSEGPFRNYDEALKYATLLVQDNPNDARNLFAMANLYEKFDKVADAEATYKKVSDLNPNDAKACGALARFYNTPLWEGKSKFDQAIEVLERCAGLTPDDPAGYQKVATFFWDKAYRDPNLTDSQKDAYADKGIEAVDKALKIKPDYFEAIIFKGLLYRVKAQVATNPRLRMQYLDDAQSLQKLGLEKKKEMSASAAVSPAPSPGQ